MKADHRYLNEQFNQVYSRLFAEFHKKVMHEYINTKSAYIEEYQENYRMNIAEKDANIEQYKVQIAEYEATTVTLYDEYDHYLKIARRFFKL